jgi:phytoene synthase
MASDPKLSPIAALVRRHDPDRFLTALFAPAARREDLLLLYAFNYEIAKTREVVTEPMLGRIRLQWWRDSLEAIYAGDPVRHHEIVSPLADLIRRRRLARAHFDALIDAREADLREGGPETMAALEIYARDSAGRLVALALEALGVHDQASATAGQALGTGYALTGLLRSVPFHARAKRLYLPADLVAAARMAPHRDLFELRSTPALAQIVGQVAERARANLAEARRFRVPRRALPALLPGVLAARWLKVLHGVGHNVFDPRLGQPDTLKSWRLAWATLSGRY